MSDFLPVTLGIDSAVLRDPPGFGGNAVATLKRGDTLEYKPGAVLDWTVDDHYWIVARVDGREGWLGYRDTPDELFSEDDEEDTTPIPIVLPPVVTLPLPELMLTPMERDGLVKALRWLADVVEHAPGVKIE